MRSNAQNPRTGLRSGLMRAGVALLMTALIPVQALALVTPGPIRPVKKPVAPKATALSRWTDLASQNPATKVDPTVQEAFSKGQGQVTYLVKLRTRADITTAAASARTSATPAQAKVKARSAVITALRETAETTQAALLADLARYQAQGQVTRVQPYFIANVVSVTSTRAVMEQVARRNDVEKISANTSIFLVGERQRTPVAPSLEQELKAVKPESAPAPQSVEWGIDRVGAPDVWSQFGLDGTGVVVAGLDSGVDWTHEALHNQYRGVDPVTGQVDHTYSWFDAVGGQAAPYDDHGHGTHTTGTMVGRDPAGVNEIGVAPGAKWIHAKILDSTGHGSLEGIIAAGEWLLAPGGDPSMAPDVVNNSWGSGPGLDEWFREVVIAWREAGIVPLFAAGNDGPGVGSISIPGNYPESIAVGATDSNDGLAGFSGRGPSPYGEMKPEISAPGVNVRSSVPGGGYEGGWNGTSMATPHVVGTVALLLQADSSLTVDEVEQILTDSADPMTNAQYPNSPNDGYGHGILNAYTAVGMIVSGIGSVSGRVLTSGDDLSAPVVSHTPVTEAFRYTDTTILADITDNTSVTDAYLRFRMPGMRWWGIVDMERIAGDHRNGTYEGVIPGDIAFGDAVEYYIQAVDFAGNSGFHGTKAAPHTITLLDGVTPGYSEDFEGAAVGWVELGAPEGTWEIGEPTSGPGAANSGTRVAATKLAGNYPDGAESFLVSPPIDLSSGSAALRFYHWYELETNWDYGVVAATGNGGETWEILSVYTGLNGAYEEAVVDLAPYAGNPAVYVAFVLISDSVVNLAGWYIDDVELYNDNQAPSAPTNVMATPTPVGSIAVHWDPVPAGDLSHYTVYRSTTAGSGFAPIGNTNRTDFADANTVAGTTYYYAVTATDTFGNEGAPSAVASATAANVTLLFSDNMEGGQGSWTHSGAGDPWELGAPTSGPGSAFSGTNLWATNLDGDYLDNTNAALVTPPINLSGMSTAALQFSHWYSLERNFDFGRVEISSDGNNWAQLAQYTAPGSGGQPVGWESPLIDLTSYVGQTVQIRFRLTSDTSVVFDGWYIDDVVVAGAASGSSQFDRSLSAKETRIELKNKAKPSAPQTIKMALPKAQTATYRLDKSTGTGSVVTQGIGIMSLPVANATVTVMETGRVVRTSPVDGSFQLTLPAGTYTLQAEAYGYYPAQRTVTVTDGGNASAIFMLEPMPRGLIHGVVTDARTGQPVEGARAWVAEDLNIPAATTGPDGTFTLDVLAGSYTVEVRHLNYNAASTTADVPANGSVDVAVAMTPFVGMPGEIGYDDGVGENAWAFFAAGNGWAVRMSPERPGQSTLVTGARYFLWDESWPAPGGNSFRAAIFAANPNGTPGALLAGPIRVENGVRGAWNEVDFSEYGVMVDGDFFVAWIQDVDYPNTPGLTVDESNADTGRNWQMVDGSWSEWADSGNLMIRAVVRYAVDAPTITNPVDGAMTNNPNVLVEGLGVADATVQLYVDGAMAAETAPDAEGTFSATVTMSEGEHMLTATTTVDGSGVTEPSAPIRVTVDMTAPGLTVSAPGQGHSQNHRVLTVSGQATDTHLAGVTVNGTAADLQADGSFTVEVLGREGENLVQVTATDLAGNATTVERTVMVDSVAPAISNPEPADDQNLESGDSITLSFDSEPGLAMAAFKIVLDAAAGGQATPGAMSLEPGEVAMTEVAPGHYEATWTVPDGLSVNAAYVQFRAVDSAGNTTRMTAPGVLHISGGQGNGPRAVIQAPTTGSLRDRLTFDGASSSSPNGPIVSYRWDLGDGRVFTKSVVRTSYRRAGTYTVTLTVTDATGASASSSVTVVITQ